MPPAALNPINLPVFDLNVQIALNITIPKIKVAFTNALPLTEKASLLIYYKNTKHFVIKNLWMF